ncbi:MAG: mechanosensitive ion channel family protein [Prochlorococcus sp.]
MRHWPPHRLRNVLLACFLGLTVSLSLPLTGTGHSYGISQPEQEQQIQLIQLQDQPFYADLLKRSSNWTDSPLGQVAGESPRATLLDFYAVMADVCHRINQITQTAGTDPGFRWSKVQRQKIEETERLFDLGVQSLDASVFPESVRKYLADEAAIQLKHVLDYAFTQNRYPINIPDKASFTALNESQNEKFDTWRLPGTSITLTTNISADPDNIEFLFSAETVKRVHKLYAEVENIDLAESQFVTPSFYDSFIYTPGHLVPPKWYINLPNSVHSIIEAHVYGQTLFQISFSAISFLIFSVSVFILGQYLLKTYNYQHEAQPEEEAIWNQDNVAWLRVLLIAPILPLTRLTELFVDEYLNLTGSPLVFTTNLFEILYFLSGSLFGFYIFEALGRSSAEWLLKLRGGSSPLQLRRLNNLLMPICRTLGVLTAVLLIYRLLILLGLPTNTVLAFSAVPGLAIGLGASKLLGNLFAGLSIQTDRPIRVGEFCRIGDNLGFVTKIGLRSMELQTLESNVTIPNTSADEATIVNFSRRSRAVRGEAMQGLELKLDIEHLVSPEQVDDLLFYVRNYINNLEILHEPLASIDQDNSDTLTLIFFAMVSLQDWPAYLKIREFLLLHLQEIIDTVAKSRIVIGVSYDTTSEQLKIIPELIRNLVNSDSQFSFRSCRLMNISEFTYDFVFDFRSSHPTYIAFKDGINQINQTILRVFADHNIIIPFPTAVEIQRDL